MQLPRLLKLSERHSRRGTRGGTFVHNILWLMGLLRRGTTVPRAMGVMGGAFRPQRFSLAGLLYCTAEPYPMPWGVWKVLLAPNIVWLAAFLN